MNPLEYLDSHCPYCGAALTLEIDCSAGTSQDYIEDCQLCCQPIRVLVELDPAQIVLNLHRHDQ